MICAPISRVQAVTTTIPIRHRTSQSQTNIPTRSLAMDKVNPQVQNIVTVKYQTLQKSVYDAVQEFGNPSYDLIPVHNEDPTYISQQP
ncbi:unnamed protein product [Caenorhabditis bovis]|uniref:Uncharacterized protein n=1 Tax=Caenorhabditis bovis TaxID=2654633 RepID=A0A8S1F434_9PELO|nr:unnamed protein product [Caenorhabditis bovis]CAB3407331.1 unnamed protein product [Caenorhabditis bovis]